MADRKITIPDSISVRGTQYTFAMFLGEFVWSYPKWSEDGWEEACIRIGEAVDLLEQNGELLLTLEDFEKLREAVKAANISGPLAPKLRKMSRAIRSAVQA
jgi:hypothetical protein